MSADGTPAPKRTGASMNRHRSVQEVATPRDFMDAIEKRFGRIDFDLAASDDNAVCPEYYDKAADSLKQDWRALDGLSWLNCEYGDIAPWAKKCAAESSSRHRILLLTPASVDAHWFWDFVRPNAIVYAVSPRIRFVGHESSYPKPLLVSLFGMGANAFGRFRWEPNAERGKRGGYDGDSAPPIYTRTPQELGFTRTETNEEG